MAYQFSSLDIQLIRSSLATKTNEQIADILEAPLDVVIKKISELYPGSAAERQVAVKAKQADIERKKIIKEKELAEKKRRKRLREEERIRTEKEKKDRFSRDSLAEKRRRELATRSDRRVYATRNQNLDKKISVRIDAKTHLFVDPGADIEKIKKFYAKNVMHKE